MFNLKKNSSKRSCALLISGLALLIGLAGCGSSSKSPSSTATATPSSTKVAPTPSASAIKPSIAPVKPTAAPVKVSSDLNNIEVIDKKGIPEIKVPAPWAIDKTRVKVISKGEGPVVTTNDDIGISYKGVDGRTGKIFDESYAKGKPVFFNLGQVIAGFKKGLSGQNVGSRVLVAIPGSEAYDPMGGNPQAGIKLGDTLVFVVDIKSRLYKTAEGAAQKIPADMPQVTVSEKGPIISIPQGIKKPTSLKVVPLVVGTGVKIKAEDSLMVKYRSVSWDTKKVFQDGWDEAIRGELPKTIAGWKQGLVGKTVGSRIMLIVPPDLAYPKGNSVPPLEAGQTLVYVIDILGISS